MNLDTDMQWAFTAGVKKYMDEKDTVLFESTSEMPATILCNEQQWNEMGPLYKAFKIIKEGDSIFYDRHAGHRIEIGDDVYYVIRFQDVVIVL